MLTLFTPIGVVSISKGELRTIMCSLRTCHIVRHCTQKILIDCDNRSIIDASEQVAYMDVGKGREQERKLEGSPSDRPGTNCIFDKKSEIIATCRFQADF